MKQGSRHTAPFGALPDGILLVDKPAGMTSHDVVDRIRRRFGAPKVGHAGTLDPQATGLLVIMLGRATKLADRLMAEDKIYEGVFRLGVATDTQDGDGQVVQERDCSAVARADVERAMAGLTGDLMQLPPMVSALKKNGVPLYRLARKGQVVERQPRLVRVYEFTLLDFQPPSGAFRVRCSKGCYVRTLCADLGEALGCGAYLEQLRRLASGAFKLSEAAPLGDILNLARADLIRLIVPSPRVPLSG